MILAARIFAMVSGVMWCFTLVGIPIGIFNFMAAKKLEQVENGEIQPDEAKNWAIYLIFTSTIGGILALLGLSDLEKGSQKSASLESKLKEIENLYDRGIISKEEYENRRRSIIETI